MTGLLNASKEVQTAERQSLYSAIDQLLEMADNAVGSAVVAEAKEAERRAVKASAPERFPAPPREYFSDVEGPALAEMHLRDCRVVPGREAILKLLPKGGVCAQLGTQTGYFARQILRAIEPVKFHLYDVDRAVFNRVDFERELSGGSVELHGIGSGESLAQEADQSFDLIYIHPRHSLEGAAADLALAARKMKSGGWILCGDYTAFSPLEGVKHGVYRAVNEFCHQNPFVIACLGLHALGYHTVALAKRKAGPAEDHLGGAFLDEPDVNTFMPDVWEHLIAKYGVKSVLDVGAGVGWSTKWFAEHGMEAAGVEGWEEALARSPCRELMTGHDFNKGPYAPGRRFDLAWCSEFVEHIEEKYVANFMAAFQACDYVCLTHGEPGQPGYHHVNCQTTEYWIETMKRHGFEYDAQETAWLRSTNQNNAPWGRKTLTFFVQKGKRS